jgi:phosphohistidine phosphatase
MILYILRHAIAAEKTEWRGSDAERPLTKDGIRKMKKTARGIRKLGVTINWILTSPYRRAYDTAMIVAKELKMKKNLKSSRMLAVNGDPKALVRHLGRQFYSWESVMVVGHEPYLGQLIGRLTSGHAEGGPPLEKGGLARLSADSLEYDKCANLEWLLTPKILKKLT